MDPIKKYFQLVSPNEKEKKAHAVPFPLLVLVFGALLFLTYITVAATYFDFGALNIWVAMFIAVIKGTLVCLYFMHLRWDKPFNTYMFIGGLAGVALFIIFALTDTQQYDEDIIWIDRSPPPVVQSAPSEDAGH